MKKKQPKPQKKAAVKKKPAQGAACAILTADHAAARAVAAVAPGAAVAADARALESAVATGARTVFIDARFSGENVYEVIRRIRMKGRARIALLHPNAKRLEPAVRALTRFAGAEAVLSLPAKAAELRAFLKPSGAAGATDALLAAKEGGANASDSYRERILRDVANPHDPSLLESISDPETRLYSSAYGSFAYDSEFKRAVRFGLPLSVALVGFEGEAATETLLEMAGIFLNEIRDTDTIARFNVSTFLFILPNTPADGARALLERIAASVTQRGLRDLVGDAISLSGGLASAELRADEHRDQLFTRVQRAFHRARSESLAAVVA